MEYVGVFPGNKYEFVPRVQVNKLSLNWCLLSFWFFLNSDISFIVLTEAQRPNLTSAQKMGLKSTDISFELEIKKVKCIFRCIYFTGTNPSTSITLTYTHTIFKYDFYNYFLL